MSQTTGVPMLGLHGLPPLKLKDHDTRTETNDVEGKSQTGSLESSPRNYSRQHTPRTPVVLHKTPLMSISSPLRMVGRASPCSVKLKGSARLEGGHVVATLQTSQSDASYPRELSFGNLLENDSTEGKVPGSNRFPKPIGLCPVRQEDSSSMPLSPRKRSRKAAPVRASVNALWAREYSKSVEREGMTYDFFWDKYMIKIQDIPCCTLIPSRGILVIWTADTLEIFSNIDIQLFLIFTAFPR